MCNIDHKLTFCSCEDFADAKYIWGLYKNLGECSFRLGRVIPPVENIEGLTGDFVLAALNTNAFFDFKYTPVNGDILNITAKGDGYSYLSFVFNGHKWNEKWVDGLNYDTRKVSDGCLKIH